MPLIGGIHVDFAGTKQSLKLFSACLLYPVIASAAVLGLRRISFENRKDLMAEPE